jgi:bifunctional UDP-N-acetylglucosamine pyrophosphorylase/glucosamine-1-phosphate N-acetyltransferase
MTTRTDKLGETTTAVILAAGQGTRMRSATPKVMHTVCGLPIVHHAVRAALDAGCGEVVVVVGYGRELVERYLAQAFAGQNVRTSVQEQQRGTGDAARVGLAAAGAKTDRVLVFYGDVPLVSADHLRAVAGALDAAVALALATCIVDDPTGYGRVLRRGGKVVEVREERDLRSAEERAVREINPGIYASGVALLREGLASLAPDNAQGELYLTDVVSFAHGAAKGVATVPLDAAVLAGVNDRDQLAGVEHAMYDRIARKWRLAGATVRDGARVDAAVELEPDATIEAGVVLRGTTRVARGATVDVGCVLTNVEVGEGALLKPYSVGADSRIGPRAQVGPFAHLRPDSELGEEAHVGNFVETKKTRMGRGAKANHLAYLGDGVIGDGANVGAGTIFCNYDGFQKHQTVIEPGAFIGSDSQIVAPVTIGANAYVATGTTITQDVPPDSLAISRVRQENKVGYATKLRERLREAKERAKKK